MITDPPAHAFCALLCCVVLCYVLVRLVKLVLVCVYRCYCIASLAYTMLNKPETLDTTLNGLIFMFIKSQWLPCRLSDIISRRQRAPWLWPNWLYNLLQEGKEHKYRLKILHTFTRNVGATLLNSKNKLSLMSNIVCGNRVVLVKRR